MQKATTVTAWNDAVGKRVSITYSEIDDTTGKIISNNKRVDKVVTDKDAIEIIDSLLDYAQAQIEAE